MTRTSGQTAYHLKKATNPQGSWPSRLLPGEPFEEQTSHTWIVFEIRDDGIRQLAQQRIECLRGHGFRQEHLDFLQVALEVGRELDGVAGCHGKSGAVNP